MKTNNLKNVEDSSSNPKANLSPVASEHARLIERLTTARRIYRLLAPEQQSAFKAGILFFFHELEIQERLNTWTSCPLENELNETSTLGDHLYATRRSMGITG